MTEEQGATTPADFWRGPFGNEYHERQTVTMAANCALFGRILSATDGVTSLAELGAGTGLNLRALKMLGHLGSKDRPWGFPQFDLCGVDVNAEAVRQILSIGGVIGVESAVQDWRPTRQFDLTFTKGMLIHIPPADLPAVYETLVTASSKYVCVAEYYNPSPVEVEYRGHAGRLWKRDFAGELMDRHGLQLVDYGFAYHRGPHPQDDISWFLLRRGAAT